MVEDNRIVIGCPVRARGWILPKWREHALAAAEEAGVAAQFVFVCDQEDVATVDWPNTTHVIRSSVGSYEQPHSWHTERYVQMVEFRNALLAEVRTMKPLFFLSLDSDILLHPQAIRGMLEVFSMHPEAWAVGGKAHLSGGEHFPTYGMWKGSNHHSITRGPYSDVRIADVLMAVKMMKPQAYHVDYEFHPWGEDLGWSSRAKLKGAKFWWDGRFCNKHVMKPEHLEVVDERCGF